MLQSKSNFITVFAALYSFKQLKYLRYITLLLLLLIIQISAYAESTLEKQDILLLNSYHQRMPWVQDILKGVEDTLVPDKSYISLHIENMDTKKYNSAAYFQSFKNYLAVKYANTKLSLILSSDNNSYDFLREHRDELFPGVPVVFCGVNNFSKDQISTVSLITGATEVFSADTTVRLARKLIPDLQKVYIINDYLKTGRLWEADIRYQLKTQEDKLVFEYAENLSLTELLNKVKTLSPDTAVLLGAYFSDRNGTFYTYEHVAEMVSQASNVPVFCLIEFIIDEGMVGGQVISGYYQGRSMAKLALQVLDNTDISEIPVMHKGSNKPIFNYEQLKRFNLDENNLPADAIVIKRPYSFYAEYRLQIWIVSGFICVLIATIVLLYANIQQRKRAESALRSSEKRTRQQADATWEALVIHDNGILIEANEMFENLTGYSLDEIRGKEIIPLIFPTEYQAFIKERLASKNLEKYEALAQNKNGNVFPIEVRVRSIEYDGREVRVAAIRDLSERKRMEEQLTHAQKMEAIGTLAGGIAHDFNNILSAILGYTEILLFNKKDEPETTEKLQQIQHAGNRAKLLVQQILTFARKSERRKQSLQLSEVVSESLKLLRASLPSTIEIREAIASHGCVESEMTKMHQVVLNLCTNAAKAMPDGGIIDISLSEIDVDKTTTNKYPDLSIGSFLCLTVKDTGKGISAENYDKIFDPFFTTEDKDKGTGLGLAVVHGIVAESKGNITVESKENEGTIFSVYLPKVECEPTTDDEISHELPRGSETIMIIDDEEDLITVGVETLSSLGYSVEGYNNSLEATQSFKSDPDRYDLVITDFTMPEMSGEVVAQEILKSNPFTPIILCSGYSETFTEDDAKAVGIKRFLLKPVSYSDLATNVRQVLDEAVGIRNK